MTIRKAYVSTSRGQLHYRTCGVGQPLVLLQILPFASLMFEPLMPKLADKGYACFAFDLMGYGRSDRRTDAWNVAHYSDNLLEALGLIGLEEFALLGGHFSALVAIDAALRYADRISRLVLDGIPVWDHQERAERRARNVEMPLLQADGKLILGLWEFAYKVLCTADPEARLDPQSQSAFLDCFSAFLALGHKPGPADAFFEFPTVEALMSVSIPTLVIGSKTDSLAANHQRALQLVRGARGEFFEDLNPLYALTRRPTDEALSRYARILDGFIRAPDHRADRTR